MLATNCSAVPLIQTANGRQCYYRTCALAQQNGRAHEFKVGQRPPRVRQCAAELIVVEHPTGMYEGWEGNRATLVDHKFCESTMHSL
jgi:hypothetical protein